MKSTARQKPIDGQESDVGTSCRTSMAVAALQVIVKLAVGLLALMVAPAA